MARRLIHAADRRVTQTLASGTIVRQDFGTAVRVVLFETGDQAWPIATHGGTLFVVIYRGRPYGLTCRHVFKSFDWGQLIVSNLKDCGTHQADPRSIAYPSNPTGDAVDTDMLDIAVLQFGAEIGPGFFRDSGYIIDPKTVTTSKVGDQLHVSGALKSPSEITETEVAPKFCLLEMVDDTPDSNDPTLRSAFSMFERPQFQDVVGLSGSPVFNLTQSALCGMVVRGAMDKDNCRLWYVDMFDICKLLAAVHDGDESTFYHKTITKLVRVPLAR
jgi:hypothetical protein